MSFIGVSPTDGAKFLKLIVQVRDAFGEDGSEEQYQQAVKSNQQLLDSLKEARDHLNECGSEAWRMRADETIESLEQRQRFLQNRYGSRFECVKKGKLHQIAKGWAILDFAFRGSKKHREDTILDRAKYDAAIMTMVM